MTIFYRDDILEVVNPLDEDGERIEGMLLGDEVIVLDFCTTGREYVMVQRTRDGKKKQLPVSMFRYLRRVW